MKKTLSVILIVCLMLTVLPMGLFSINVCAETYEDFTYEISDDQVTITGYIGNDNDIIIPAAVGEYPVTAIGKKAFQHSIVTSVIIPDSVVTIGAEAFRDCMNLMSVNIPNGITTINEHVFESCVNLTNIVIPDSVTKLSSHAFAFSGITSAKIGANVTTIEKGAFRVCHNLISFNVAEENSYYSSLDGVLFNKNKTTLIQCPVKKAGSYNIPDGVIVIESLAFTACKQLTSVIIPNTVKTISDSLWGCGVFSYCTGITEIKIPDSVTNVGGVAFSECTNLKKVSLGSGVTYFDGRVFDDCDNLEEFEVSKENQCLSAINGVLFNKQLTNLIKYPISKKGEFIIPSSVETIGSFSFSGCNEITKIIIPDSVISIGEHAFSYCTGLISLTLGSGITNMESYAFSDCYNLTDLTISEGITVIGESAFYDCSGLTSVTIPNSVNQIEPSAFCSCDNLNNVIIGNGVTSIGDYAFEYCKSLSSITIPEGVTSIGENAFEYCKSLLSITIPQSVTSIYSYAFSGCTALSSITIPEGVTSIGDYAFSKCINLENIVVDENNSTYDSRDNCNAIIETATNTLIIGCKNTIIPSSVTDIGNYSFYDCETLENITIPQSVTSIGDYAFFDCYNLVHVFYGGSEDDWNNISIGYYNTGLVNATHHYNVSGTGMVFSKTIEPSCTAKGYDLYCCSECDYEYRTNIKEALGHNAVGGVCINCGLSEDLFIESSHPYEKYTDESWTINKPGAKSISITFSEDTETQNNWGYIYIYDRDDNQIGTYSGTSLAGETITVSGDAVRIRLKSYGGSTHYGFALSDVVIEYESSSSEPTETPTEVPTENPTQATDPTEPITSESVTTEPATTLPAETEPTTIISESTDATEITFPEDYILDKDTDIAIAGDTDAELVVSNITSDKQIEDIDLILVGEKVSKVFDITLQKDGVEVQPDSKVFVRIPAENPNSRVYRMEKDGTLTDMNAVFLDGYLIFATEHFSLYVVAEKIEESEVTYLIGDANGDGKVNVKDATQIQKAAASLVTLDDTASLCADVNSDGKVNVKDATAIQKYSANFETGFAIGTEIKLKKDLAD